MLEEMLCEKQTDVGKFQNCVATLKELSEENKITILKSDCDFDEIGGPGTEKPWFNNIIGFTIMDNDTMDVYSLCVDTYHGRFSFVKIDKNDYELFKCPSCHADLIDYKTRRGKYELRCKCGGKIYMKR